MPVFGRVKRRIQMRAVIAVLSYIFELKALQGYRTAIAAAGALAGAVYFLSQKEYEKAVASFVAFLGLIGLKSPPDALAVVLVSPDPEPAPPATAAPSFNAATRIFAAVLAVLFAGLGYAGDAPPPLWPLEGPPPEFALPPGEVPQAGPQGLTADQVADKTDWGAERCNILAAHAAGFTGKGATIAVLDTGANSRHRDLSSDLRAESTSGFPAEAQDGHGPHCQGTAFGRKNDFGIYGAAPDARGVSIRVFNANSPPTARADHIAAGIDRAVALGADVISLSIGGGGADRWQGTAIQRAIAAGVIVVAASGNENAGQPSYPAAYPGVVAVGATDPADRRAGFSNRLPAVAAPGVDIISCWTPSGANPNTFNIISGTSMACPKVAGIAALWVAAHPNVPKTERPARFRRALLRTCRDLPPVGPDAGTGAGLPDALRLCRDDGAESPTPLPVDPPPVVPPAPTVEKRVAELERRVAELEKRFSAPPPEPMPAGKVGVTPGAAVAPVSPTHQEWFHVPGVGLRLITLSGPPTLTVTPAPVFAPTFPLFGGCPGGFCPVR